MNCPRILAALLCLVFAQQTLAEPSYTNPSKRIAYDGHCIQIDGRDTFIFSGSFHYFRCPKPLWRERFSRIKQAGFNTVETYVAWNYHEREMPESLADFSKVDLTDLRDWLSMAIDEFGFNVIIRPGPYICAEWEAGGFPAWLATKRPASLKFDEWFRTDEPTFVEWSKHWYNAVCPVIAPFQITRRASGKPGVILFQLENEYDFLGLAVERKANYLKSLKRFAIDKGIDVPLFGCWTHPLRGSDDPELKDCFDAANSYTRWKLEDTAGQVDALVREQTDAPQMIAELQGGWFSNVGGMPSDKQDGITAEQCQGITLMAVAHGVTVMNYYMLFGGTNFADWGGRGITTTYDYFSPIREPGSGGAKYRVVQGIGAMLKEIGPSLARSQRIASKTDGLDANIEIVTRRSLTDGQTYVFLWNKSREKPAKGAATVHIAADEPADIAITYDLRPFGFSVLSLPRGAKASSAGRWFPEVPPAVERPPVPAAVNVSEAMVVDDPMPATWTPIDGRSYAANGISDSRYVYYRTRTKLNDSQAANFRTLTMSQEQPDAVAVLVNGSRMITESQRGRHEVSIALGEGALHAGDNEILVLYENGGIPGFGGGIAQQAGITGGALVRRDVTDVNITTWKSKLIEDPKHLDHETDVDFDDSAWPSFTLDPQSAAELENPIQPGQIVKNAAGRVLYEVRGSAVFRAEVDMTQKMLDERLTQIVFERIDEQGALFVNGKRVARHNDWNEPLIVDLADNLKLGKNSIAIVVTNDSGPGGLTRPVKLQSAKVEKIDLSFEWTKNLGGIDSHFNDAPKPSGAWKTTRLDADASDTDQNPSLVKWYRIEFELPEQSKDVWVPWLATLSADGNGMIYLNGVHLGRYWEVGPQHDFYLPECWLKFGKGQTNVLTVALRTTGKPPRLRPVRIAPYEDAAERR